MADDPTKVELNTSTMSPLVQILKNLPSDSPLQIKIGEAVFAGPATLLYSNAGAVLEFPEPPKAAPKKATPPANAGGA